MEKPLTMSPPSNAVTLALAAALAAPLAAHAQSCPDPASIVGEGGEAGEGGEVTPAEAQAAWVATIDRLLADAAAAAELAPTDPARAQDILNAASDDAIGRLMRAAGPGQEPRGAALVAAVPPDLAALEAMLPREGLLPRASALIASAATDYATAAGCGPTPGVIGDAMGAAAARGSLLRASALAAHVPGLAASLRGLLESLPRSLSEGDAAPAGVSRFLVQAAEAQLLISDSPP